VRRCSCLVNEYCFSRTIQYDESIQMKSELQNAVDRLRQKLHELEMHNQDKQNKYNHDRQQWHIERLEFIGKLNEVKLNEQRTRTYAHRRLCSSSTSNYRKLTNGNAKILTRHGRKNELTYKSNCNMDSKRSMIYKSN
jgi:hypothetical protein